MSAIEAHPAATAPAAAPAAAPGSGTASVSRPAPLWARLKARLEDLVAAPTPPAAVEFASGRIAAGRLGGTIQARALRPQTITPSAIHANLADAAALAEQLRPLLEAAGALGADVSLLVPDLTARVSVLDFDVLPTRREEIDALARFRLRKSLPFADEQAVISSQMLSPTRLLVTVADRVRLDEYENCLEAAGARAALVLPSGLTCLAAQPALDHGALLIRAEPDCLTTAFCQQGRVEFYRAIELSAPASFEDVFPSVAFFRDRVGDGGDARLLLTAGASAELQARLREEVPWAQVRPISVPEEMAIAGALRGRFA